MRTELDLQTGYKDQNKNTHLHNKRDPANTQPAQSATIMSSKRIPANFPNSFIPFESEPSREDYANGRGKVAERKAMYGDMAQHMMTMSPALCRLRDGQPTLALPERPVQQRRSRKNSKRESLLEGSVPDYPPSRGTEKATIGPISRPASQIVSRQQSFSQGSPSESDRNNSRISPHQLSTRSTEESTLTMPQPASNQSRIRPLISKPRDRPSVPAKQDSVRNPARLRRGVACAPRLSTISERSEATSHSSTASHSMRGSISVVMGETLDRPRDGMELRYRVLEFLARQNAEEENRDRNA